MRSFLVAFIGLSAISPACIAQDGLAEGVLDVEHDSPIPFSINVSILKSKQQEVAPATTPGKLTLQLFTKPGTGSPIWTEVRQGFVIPDKPRFVVNLGEIQPLLNATGEKIRLNKLPWLLVTFEEDSTSYVSTRRLPFPLTVYSHQAGSAYGATGKLLEALKDHQKRIVELEEQLAAKDKFLTETLKKLWAKTTSDPFPTP